MLVAIFIRRTGIKNASSEFLEAQGHTLSAFNNAGDRLLRQRPLASDLPDEHGRLTAVESV
jgi:hypothetical protein